MAKITASFDQDQADAVVAELSRMNIDGLDWRVDDNSGIAGDDTGVVPFAAVPGGTAGNSALGSDGAPALAAPLFAAGSRAIDDTDSESEEGFLNQARRRGATVITVNVPGEAEAAVRSLFERHSASNLVNK